MLFNSHPFILLFLPLTVAVFHILRARGWERSAFAALTIASLIFYGWWSVKGLALLVGLILINYGLARGLIARRSGDWRRGARLILIVGLAFNLGVLGYFKYANFFVQTVDQLTGVDWALRHVALPLGISFFTFQKIALLVDCHNGKVERLDFLDYVLFVAFFPQLIAGPIVHHSEVIPQFHHPPPVSWDSIAQALAIFTLGLGKKVLLADTLAQYVAPVFAAAAHGSPVGFVDGWRAALAYTLQLYFDFSGYSEMAIGAALLFGVHLPLNFASPYKAESIIDFWRRWHMTLSRFLRDYLYVPLGGNRKGATRRYLNLFLTMLLGGLWHGAGWTFIAWGALHGAYLALNHAWRRLASGREAGSAGRLLGGGLTFLSVVAAWVLFRAADLASAGRVLRGMAGLSGFAPGPAPLGAGSLGLIAALLLLVWIAPSTQELTGYNPDASAAARPAGARRRAQLAARALACGAVFAVAFLSLSKVSEFLYFQF